MEKKNMSSKNIKTAQFGGVGGGGNGSPFSPGRSPFGRGGTNRGGSELNIYVDEDDSFEKILSKTHIYLDQYNVNDENIEKQLSVQHTYTDGDLNYELSSTERLKLKLRMQLHNYKKSLEDHASSLIKNSPAYIKENFHAKPEHLRTMEESLAERRHFDDSKKRAHEYEDKVPDQIKPQRRHDVISSNNTNRTAKEYGFVRDPQDYDYPVKRRNRFTVKPEGEPNNQFDEYQFHSFPDGQYKVLDGLAGFEGLEEYLNEGNQANRSYQDTSGYNEETMLRNPYPDTKANVVPMQEMGQKIQMNPKEISIFNQHGKSFPGNYYDYNDMGGEDKGVEEIYDGIGLYGHFSPNPS
jgi:hypothetical protein